MATPYLTGVGEETCMRIEPPALVLAIQAHILPPHNLHHNTKKYIYIYIYPFTMDGI